MQAPARVTAPFCAASKMVLSLYAVNISTTKHVNSRTGSLAVALRLSRKGDNDAKNALSCVEVQMMQMLRQRRDEKAAA